MRGPSRNRTTAHRRHRSIGLRGVILLVAVGGIVLSGTSVAWVAERDTRRALESELEGRLLAEARSLARVSSDALLADFPELVLVPLITELCQQRPEITRVVVTDHEGRVRGAQDPRELGQLASGGKGGASPIALGAAPTVSHDAVSIVVSCPVFSTTGKPIGRIALSASSDYIHGILARSRTKAVGATLALVFAGAVLAFLLISRALRPLREIREGLGRIGRGDLKTPIAVDDAWELGELAGTVNEMTVALDDAQKDLVEKERLRHEMELAQDLQHSLLSLEDREFGSYRISTSYHPAMEVGGDYCDVFEIDKDQVALVIADVSGKGLGGCLVTAMLSVGLRSLPLGRRSPRLALIELERRLAPSLRPGTFVTIFFGVLDTRTHRLRFVSAAHNPLLIIRANGSHDYRYTKGVPLGALSGGALAATLSDEEITLQPGDVIVQTTDGITEAKSRKDGQQLGFDRLADVASSVAAGGTLEVVEGIRSTVANWRGEGGEIDDETLLVVGRTQDDAAAVGSDRVDVDPAALESLKQLMEDRDHLRLSASTDDLALLPAWLNSCADLRGLDTDHMTILHHGIYEACSNVIEHCYALDPDRTFDLWRLPAATGGPEEPCDSLGPTSVLRRVQSGYFLIRDDGRTYDAEAWTPTNFEDPEARSRGRGIGLDLIHASMRTVTYLPGTRVGNVTLLRFDPQKHSNKETNHDRAHRDPIPR